MQWGGWCLCLSSPVTGAHTFSLIVPLSLYLSIILLLTFFVFSSFSPCLGFFLADHLTALVVTTWFDFFSRIQELFIILLLRSNECVFVHFWYSSVRSSRWSRVNNGFFLRKQHGCYTYIYSYIWLFVIFHHIIEMITNWCCMNVCFNSGYTLFLFVFYLEEREIWRIASGIASLLLVAICFLLVAR